MQRKKTPTNYGSIRQPDIPEPTLTTPPKNTITKLLHNQAFQQKVKAAEHSQVDKHPLAFIGTSFIEMFSATATGGLTELGLKNLSVNITWQILAKSYLGSMCFALINVIVNLLKNKASHKMIENLTEEEIKKIIDQAADYDSSEILNEIKTQIQNAHIELTEAQKEYLFDQIKINNKILCRSFFYNLLITGSLFTALNTALAIFSEYPISAKYIFTTIARTLFSVVNPLLMNYGFWIQQPLLISIASAFFGFNAMTAAEAAFDFSSEIANIFLIATASGIANCLPRIAVKCFDGIRNWYYKRSIPTSTTELQNVTVAEEDASQQSLLLNTASI